jgi:hypothetical protein
MLLLLLVAHPPVIATAEPPAQRLELSRWKLTLPVDTCRPGSPDEISWPALESFSDQHYFFAHPQGPGVVFRAPSGGIPTKGSKYPRCELREMKNSKTEAAWSTDDDQLHTLALRLAVTHLPAVKKHVVCAQIHDAHDDVLMVRLEDKKLFIERPGQPDVRLDVHYALGSPFDLKIQAGRGRIRVWHNHEQKLDWQTSRPGCYFKAGCYTQSNPVAGDAPDAYGEVVLYSLMLAP